MKDESSTIENFRPILSSFKDDVFLGQFASTQYLQYAIATVKERALPRVSDGQKPVQARVLYAMNEMRANYDSNRKKSARVVGDVLGKFHPHGDSSVYDAMVRMSQSFTLRYPLIDGEGNFGSRDGDDAAAMRYTEARLSNFSEILLDELKQGTVEYVSNYDGSLQEPKQLPSRLPVILLNGASGIAVGMATEIPSHNLVEVCNACIAMIKNKNISLSRILKYIKGPDFSCGGHIISSSDELHNIYKLGKGSIRLRGRYKIENLARGQWQIVFEELPQFTSTKKILEEINAITNPILKTGKKHLSSEQLREKQYLLTMLDDVRDESDRQNPVRLVFEPKTSKIDKVKLIDFLLYKTSLEGNVSVNLVMIGIDGRPKTMSLNSIITEWLDFRCSVVKKRLSTKLDKVENRLEIMNGRNIVILNIEKVIEIIRFSDNPKIELKKNYNLTDLQTDDILDIRLKQLSKLETIKIIEEINNLKTEKKVLKELLQRKDKFKKLIIDEISLDKKKFGDKRKTLIQESERSFFITPTIEESITIIFSKNAWIQVRSGWNVDIKSLNFKSSDHISSRYEIKTSSNVILIDSMGRSYSINAQNIPRNRGSGIPAATIIDMQHSGRVLFCLSGRLDDYVLLTSNSGYGFLTQIKSLVTSKKIGREILNLSDGEIPLRPILVDNKKEKYVSCISEKGRLLIFPIEELRLMTKGKGSILMGLHDNEKINDINIYDSKKIVICGKTQRSRKDKNIIISGEKFSYFFSKRARMGRLIPKKLIDYKFCDSKLF